VDFLPAIPVKDTITERRSKRGEKRKIEFEVREEERGQIRSGTREEEERVHFLVF
jgi:hypothetical protein